MKKRAERHAFIQRKEVAISRNQKTESDLLLAESAVTRNVQHWTIAEMHKGCLREIRRVAISRCRLGNFNLQVGGPERDLLLAET